MKQNICVLLGLTLLVSAMLGLWHLLYRPAYNLTSITPERELTQNVLLVPLDGRPPCRQFVIDAGQIAGIDVITPPSEIQDYYSQPGNPAQMRQWLAQNITGKNGAIISIDQLLYGGLLAAREKEATPEEMQALIDFLRDLHAQHPEVPLYAFSILPRQTPQDSIDGYQEKRDLLAYSRLKGKQAAGLAIDDAELERLQESIPEKAMQTYLHHFEENEALNKALIQLAQEGVLTKLILGQDDGEPYSIPNIEKQQLISFMQANNISETKVALTHGADEIALTTLAGFYGQQQSYRPKIYVEYSDGSAATRIMPFMAINVGETVWEKLNLIGAQQVLSPDVADFILYVSANDSEENSMNSRAQTVQYLFDAKKHGNAIALVDLSKHFAASETVLPLLISEDYPLNNLIAYAGWNTTSNAIGTAVAQGALYTLTKRQSHDTNEAMGIVATNLEFLQNRILEDYFYLKEDIDTINQTLKKSGYQNTADLDLEHNYRWATEMLQTSMDKHLETYKNTKSVRTPVTYHFPSGDFTLATQNIKADVSFPWPRTFEIYMHTTLFFAQEN